MSFDANNIPFGYLMQPELLDEHDLRRILIERCVHVENIERLNKEQLLNIFHRVVTPLQQRTRFELKRPELNGTGKTGQLNDTFPLKNGILKQITDENIAKRIKLSSSPHKVHLKRPNTDRDISEDVPTVKKARQKITWP